MNTLPSRNSGSLLENKPDEPTPHVTKATSPSQPSPPRASSFALLCFAPRDYESNQNIGFCHAYSTQQTFNPAKLLSSHTSKRASRGASTPFTSTSSSSAIPLHVAHSLLVHIASVDTDIYKNIYL